MGYDVMSINSEMKPYNLYVNNPKENSYGQMVDNYVFEKEVMVALYFNSINKISNDIRYKDCQYTGLTRCKGLDLSKEYKLIPKEKESPEYIIKSINELSRLTQYILQAVI